MLGERHSKQLNNIKANLLLKDVIPYLDTLPLNTCPFCKKEGKWKIRSKGELGTCYSSKCAIRSFNKHGMCDVITAYRLVREGSVGFIKAIEDLDTLVSSSLGLDSVTSYLDTRHKVVSQVWRTYTKELSSNHGTPGLEYLLERGFKKEVIQELGIGYASNNTLKRNLNLSWEDLHQHRFVNVESGKEFFWQSVIFPVRDMFGRFLHLQGRSICKEIPKNESGDDKWPRYKATSSVVGIPNIDMFMFLEHKLGIYKCSPQGTFVCEGVPDVLSVYQSGGNALGIFGTHGLLRNAHKLEGLREITIVADNDRYDNNHPYYAGLYKSWERLIPQLISLQLTCPDSTVYIFIPPYEVNNQGVKDVNDMFRAGLQGYELINHIIENRVHLPKFLLSSKFNEPSYHLDILKVINITGMCKEELESLILSKYGNYMDYLMNVIAL